MSLKDTSRSLENHIKEAYVALEENNYYLPEQKNAENLAKTIRREFKPPYDPSNPTLEGIKNALLAGDYEAFPIGTEIPDTWNGNNNPLIVGTYTTIQCTDGESRKAVGLVRKWIEPTVQRWGNNNNYATSSILNYLNNTYLTYCSETLKSIIREVYVKWSNGTSVIDVAGKWHLFSGIELYGTYNAGEGTVWEYWKKSTGLSSPNNNSNSGRSRQGRDGKNYVWWTRSRNGASNINNVVLDGYVGVLDSGRYDDSLGVLPHCYIVAD